LDMISWRYSLAPRQRNLFCQWKYRERITQYSCLLYLQDLLTSRKQAPSHPHNFLSSCFCSFLDTLSVCREPDASFRHSKFLSQIQNSHVLLYRLRHIFHRFIKSVDLRISKNITVWAPDHGSSETGKNCHLHKYEISFIIHWFFWEQTSFNAEQ